MRDHSLRSRRSRGGFTFAELLLTMLIVGILATVVIPNVRKISGSTSLGKAQMVITSDIQRAFSIAARRRRAIRLTYGTSPVANYTLATRGTGGAAITTFSRRFLQGTQAEYPLETVSFSTNQIDIFPDGLATDTLLVTLSISGYTRKIWFSNTGQMRIRP